MSKQGFNLTTAALCIATCALPKLASAQTNDSANVAAAQQLYDEGVKLLQAQRYVEACLKLEKVTVLVPKGVGGHETLAECYKQIGRLGSAWEHYTTARVLAYAAAQIERAQRNADSAKELESRVAKITIVVRKEMDAIQGLVVLRDGQPQERALWNTPLPVDAGEHVIEVKAPDRKPWSGKVMILADGAAVKVNVGVGVVDPGPVRAWQKPVGWTAIGVGGASLITMGILSGIAVTKKNASNADGHCGANNVCDNVGLPLRDQAMSLANGATATLVIGGVLAAGGLVLVLTAPKANKEQDAAGKTGGLSLSTTISPTGIGLHGTW
jgi:hypothetical protein